MKISKEVKTAILAIVAIALLIFGYSFMKGNNLFDSSRKFYAVYNNVQGLSSSSKVTINGLKVGTVSSIGFLNDKGQVLVTLHVESEFKFSKNSTARIYGGSFIGGKSMEIIPDYKAGIAKSGDTLKGDIEEGLLELVNERLTPLQEKIENVVVSVDTLVTSLNQVMDSTGRRNLKEGLSKFNNTMTRLNNSSIKIDKLLSDNTVKLDTTFTNLSETVYNFNTLSDSLAQIKVEPLLVKVNDVLDNFKEASDKLNSKEGTAGKLLNDDKVYNNLEHATKQLEELIQDIKLNPKRYVNVKFSLFGGKSKSKPYKKPKDSLK